LQALAVPAGKGHRLAVQGEYEQGRSRTPGTTRSPSFEIQCTGSSRTSSANALRSLAVK
jgi:hypothetical protein